MKETAYYKLLHSAQTVASQPDSYIGLERLTKLFKGNDAAFVALSKLDVDTDGKRHLGIHYESTHQDQTTIDPRASWCDSSTIPFFVLPIGWGHGGCELGTLATIFYNGRHVHAIFADSGPRTKFGEASLAVHRALGIELVKQDGHIKDVGIDSGVTTLIYVGHKAKVPATFDEIQVVAEPLLAYWLKVKP